jgi:hypothetical protein
MATPGIVVPNLPAFRAALKAAEGATPRELTTALKAAGAPIIERAARLAPSVTGALSGSYRATVRGNTGKVTSTVPYGPGAEWGRRGKWKGFERYGVAGSRFATRALDEVSDEVADLITRGLNDILTIHGWAS